MDEKLKKIIIIVLGSFVIFFLFLFILSSCKSEMTPSQLENEVYKNAKKYYLSHESELPSSGNVLTLSLNDLVVKGIIDELDNLLSKNTSCSGSLTIENNNDYYMYSPILNCSSETDNYSTENLKDILLENVVTSGNGLYQIGNSYYFRGDIVNNYLIFDGIKWRITKINEDGSIRLIEDSRRMSVVWDDRYNSDRLSATGFNSFVYNGLNSRMKDYLDNVYSTEEILSNDAKGYIKPTSLCIGKRSAEETDTTGNIECSEVLENQYIGLIQVNEYMIASLDPSCQKTTSVECLNYNYLADLDSQYWTITADSENNYNVYKIMNTVTASNASNNGMARLVINISANTNITGTGTEEDPYVITGIDNTLKKFD